VAEAGCDSKENREAVKKVGAITVIAGTSGENENRDLEVTTQEAVSTWSSTSTA